MYVSRTAGVQGGRGRVVVGSPFTPLKMARPLVVGFYGLTFRNAFRSISADPYYISLVRLYDWPDRLTKLSPIQTKVITFVVHTKLTSFKPLFIAAYPYGTGTSFQHSAIESRDIWMKPVPLYLVAICIHRHNDESSSHRVDRVFIENGPFKRLSSG